MGNGWMDGLKMDERKMEGLDDWKDGWIDKLKKDGWTDQKWMGGWKSGWINGKWFNNQMEK